MTRWSKLRRKFYHLISHPASLIFSCLLPSPLAIETPFFLLSPDFCNCSICQETSLLSLLISLRADLQAIGLPCSLLIYRQSPRVLVQFFLLRQLLPSAIPLSLCPVKLQASEQYAGQHIQLTLRIFTLAHFYH